MNLKKQFDSSDLPFWFVFLNYAGLLPIILWPLAFFTSIFIFDNPNNILIASLLFILLNGYPFLLMGNLIMSFKIYRKQKIVGTMMPIISIGLCVYLIEHFLKSQVN